MYILEQPLAHERLVSFRVHSPFLFLSPRTSTVFSRLMRINRATWSKSTRDTNPIWRERWIKIFEVYWGISGPLKETVYLNEYLNGSIKGILTVFCRNCAVTSTCLEINSRTPTERYQPNSKKRNKSWSFLAYFGNKNASVNLKRLEAMDEVDISRPKKHSSSVVDLSKANNILVNVSVFTPLVPQYPLEPHQHLEKKLKDHSLKFCIKIYKLTKMYNVLVKHNSCL